MLRTDRILAIVAIVLVGVHLVLGHAERFEIEVEHRFQTVIVEAQSI